MKQKEVTDQLIRISKYRELEKVRDEIYGALRMVKDPWPNGPCGQGPFTGNTRETRQVKSMEIQFTHTRGGADPVGTKILNMNIEAYELGLALQRMLQEKLDLYNAEMEKV